MAKNITSIGNISTGITPTKNNSKSFQSLIPEGVKQFNNFVGNPRVSESLEKNIPIREPNLSNVYDPRNPWGVNSPLNRLGIPGNMQTVVDYPSGENITNTPTNLQKVISNVDKDNS